MEIIRIGDVLSLERLMKNFLRLKLLVLFIVPLIPCEMMILVVVYTKSAGFSIVDRFHAFSIPTNSFHATECDTKHAHHKQKLRRLRLSWSGFQSTCVGVLVPEGLHMVTTISAYQDNARKIGNEGAKYAARAA